MTNITNIYDKNIYCVHYYNNFTNTIKIAGMYNDQYTAKQRICDIMGPCVRYKSIDNTCLTNGFLTGWITKYSIGDYDHGTEALFPGNNVPIEL